MNSSVTAKFRKLFEALPADVQRLALKNYQLWRDDPRHVSLQFKPVGAFWSVRIGLAYRALGRMRGDRMHWFWIGHHSVYDRLIRG